MLHHSHHQSDLERLLVLLWESSIGQRHETAGVPKGKLTLKGVYSNQPTIWLSGNIDHRLHENIVLSTIVAHAHGAETLSFNCNEVKSLTVAAVFSFYCAVCIMHDRPFPSLDQYSIAEAVEMMFKDKSSNEQQTKVFFANVSEWNQIQLNSVGLSSS